MKKIRSIVSKIKKKGIKHIVNETIPWLFFDMFDEIFSKFVRRVYINKCLQNVIIIESHNDFDSNGGAFYNYLIKNGYNKKYKIVWFLRNKCPENLPYNVEGYRYNRLSLRRVKYQCTAKYILSEHYAIPTLRDGQVAVFMRHGAGGLKKTQNYFAFPGGIQYILGLSKTYAPIECLEKLFTNDNQHVVYLGFPSHDLLFEDNSQELKKISENSYKKVILWMPTFRKTINNRNDSSIELPLGVPLFDDMEEYIKLNDMLKEQNCFLIIKIHPMQDIETLKIHDLSNVKVITGELAKEMGIDNYKLMSCCDAMISDYSGAAYDFIQLDRPIAYVLSDMKDYKLGFVVEDIHQLIGGKEIYSLEDMFSFVKDVANGNDIYRKKRSELRDYIYTYHDGDNSKRLAEFLKLNG